MTEPSPLKTNPSSPPEYTPSTASPSYAVEPRDGEQRLELMTRPVPSTPRGTFTKKTRSFTVVLSEQEPDAAVPTYSRHAMIKGEIGIVDATDVLAVTVKVSAAHDQRLHVCAVT